MNLLLNLLDVLFGVFTYPTFAYFCIAFIIRQFNYRKPIKAFFIKSNILNWSVAVYPVIILSKHGLHLRDKDERAALLNHEMIHILQQHETFIIFGYLVYATEYFIRLIIFRDRKKAYRSLSMEMEAYVNQKDMNYRNRRKPFAWVKYLFTKNTD